jgi:DNA-binding transcriptional ArsR family regulator
VLNRIVSQPRRRGRPRLANPDEIVGQWVRLRILKALSEQPAIPFMEMHKIVKANFGSMSMHAVRLEQFGYIKIEKSFFGRAPRTEYRLTDEGRAALVHYLTEHHE